MPRAVAVVSVAAVLSALAAAPALAGKTRDEVDALQSDVNDLTAKVEKLAVDQEAVLEQLRQIREFIGLGQPGRRTPADLAADLDAVEQAVGVLGTREQDTTGRLSLLQDRVATLYRQLGQMQAQVDALLAAAAAAPPPLASAEPAPSDAAVTGAPALPAPATPALPSSAPVEPAVAASAPLEDPEELYQAARADYGRGSYGLAVAGFQRFLEAFPQSDLADNAQYWIGESFHAQSDFPQALAAFDLVTARWPDGDKAPDAAYKKGLCLLALQRTADGILQLQGVRDRHPDSEAARLARQKLESLGLQ